MKESQVKGKERRSEYQIWMFYKRPSYKKNVCVVVINLMGIVWENENDVKGSSEWIEWKVKVWVLKWKRTWEELMMNGTMLWNGKVTNLN